MENIPDTKFKPARQEMFLSDYSGAARVGCAVYYKGSLLAKAHNSDKTSLLQERYNRYRYKDCGTRYLPAKNHAELAALKKIRYLDIDFSRVEVYIYRELKNGSLAMTRPCESCMAFLKKMGIKVIHYTTDDGFATEKLI